MFIRPTILIFFDICWLIKFHGKKLNAKFCNRNKTARFFSLKNALNLCVAVLPRYRGFCNSEYGGQRIPKKKHFFEKQKKSSVTQKLKNVKKYTKISNTPFNQRSLIHRKVWFPGEPRIPQNRNCSKIWKKLSKSLEICQN